MAVNTAVVPVAGLGTRMLPVTNLVPKEFLPLGRKPAIQWVAEELARAQIKRIIFVVSPHKASLKNLFELGPVMLDSGQQIDVEYVVQHEQLGLGHAVLCARQPVGDEAFVVALGDCLIGLPEQSDLLAQLISAYESSAEIAIGLERIPPEHVHRYGIAITNAQSSPFRCRDWLRNRLSKQRPVILPSAVDTCSTQLSWKRCKKHRLTRGRRSS